LGDAAKGFEGDCMTTVLWGGINIFGGSEAMLATLPSTLVVINLREGVDLAPITGHIRTGLIGRLLILSLLVPNARAYPGKFPDRRLP
jgi:rhamnose transport system permease protein